ncbi:hypothetical protein PG985_009270 [Apiospora marii]|uniref:uncharacterized protein n=1 Tax=Apiospora marii TaxID=335849 RepID=UPI00312E7AB8
MTPPLRTSVASLPVPARPHRIQPAKPREVGDAIAQQSHWVERSRHSSTLCVWKWIDYLPSDLPSDSTASDDNSEDTDENMSDVEDDDGPVDDSMSECESGSGSDELADPDLYGGPTSRQYDSSGENALGLDWMILERITNYSSIVDHDNRVSDSGKVLKDRDSCDVGRALANCYIPAMRKTQFDKIGSLYMDDKGEYYVGCFAQPFFGCCLKASYPPPGPFDSVFDLLREYLKLWRHANDFHGNISGTCSMSPGSQGQVEAPPSRRDDAHETGDPTTTQHSDTADHGTDDSEFAFEYSKQDRQYDNMVLRDMRRLLKDLERVSSASAGIPLEHHRTYLVHRSPYDEDILVDKDQDAVQERVQGDKTTIQPPRIKALLNWDFAAVFPDELFHNNMPRDQDQFVHLGQTWVPDPLSHDFPCDVLFDPRANGDEGLGKSLVKEAWAKASRADDGTDIDDKELGNLVTLDFLGNDRDQQGSPPPPKAWVVTLRALAEALEENCWERPGDMAPRCQYFLQKLRWAFLHSKVKRRKSDPAKRELKFRYIYS